MYEQRCFMNSISGSVITTFSRSFICWMSSRSNPGGYIVLFRSVNRYLTTARGKFSITAQHIVNLYRSSSVKCVMICFIIWRS